MRRQALTILAFLIGIFLIITLSRDLQRLLDSQNRLQEEHARVQQLQAEQQELAQELEYVTSDEFVEQEARNKLLMAKPGETVVILPETEQPITEEERESSERGELENWEKWVQLFL